MANATANETALLENLNAQIAAFTAKMDTFKADKNESMDTIWMLLASALVFFMHAGFSLLEAGSVRKKNAQNILAKNLLVVTMGFLCWYFFGYGLALGAADSPGRFAGAANFAMTDFTGGDYRVWFFQGAFCATGATIVSGAMAERTQLKGFGLYTILMTTIIYPIVVYWGWSGNGIFNYTDAAGNGVSVAGPGLIDFAGSGIVHMVGGVGALVGALVVGPRKGRWRGDDDFDAHNVPFLVLGTFFLWFGWYGFNPGSTTSMHDKVSANSAGIVAVNTTLSPCMAALVVFALRAQVLAPKALDVGGMCNGALAGLVAITAGCAVMSPWESMVIGVIGGFVYQGLSSLLKYMHVDDVVDAVPVHGGCGLWGLLACGLFGDPSLGIGGNGLFYGGSNLGIQCVAAILILAWVGSLSAAVFLPLRIFGLLRLDDNFQDKGADEMEHSPNKAYGAYA